MAGQHAAHPDFAAHVVRLVDRDGLTAEALPDERQKISSVLAAPAENVDHDEHRIAAADGYDVRVIESRPRGMSPSAPSVLWVHGGGYMLGLPEMDQRRMDRWAADLGAAVYSPDYRLAPEHPHPTGFNDCWATLEWISELPSQTSNPGPVLIGGMSAGGGLAAALALKARDGNLPLAAQFLLCPMLDDRSENYLSSQLAVPGWTLHATELGWRSYLGPGGFTDALPYAVPGRFERLDGLPPTFIAVGGLDILRDEGIRYGLRLMDAAVSVDVHSYDGAPHGFSAVAPEAATSVRMEAELLAFLQRRSFDRR